jgi:hypothetical protein
MSDDGGALVLLTVLVCGCNSSNMEPANLHESVLGSLLSKLDTRSKCVMACTCKHFRGVFARPELWTHISFDDASEQLGLGASELFSVLDRSKGHVKVLHLARYTLGRSHTSWKVVAWHVCMTFLCVVRSPEARAAEGVKRFANGVKHDQLLPHTQGACAVELARKCPNLLHLSIDERASCVGGTYPGQHMYMPLILAYRCLHC